MIGVNWYFITDMLFGSSKFVNLIYNGVQNYTHRKLINGYNYDTSSI